MSLFGLIRKFPHIFILQIPGKLGLKSYVIKRQDWETIELLYLSTILRYLNFKASVFEENIFDHRKSGYSLFGEEIPL